MENFPITKTDAGFQIEGFPDAVKVVRIEGPQAKRFADLTLHKSDLEFADECLAAINKVPEQPWVLRQALWQPAVIHYMKCFGDSARFQLSSSKIYKGNPSALEAFAYFKTIRNKHFIHDENSYAQSISGAILNGRDKPYKIEKIVCFSAVAETLEQGNYNNLHLLIGTARTWVTGEADNLCKNLTTELEAKSYDELLKREALTYNVPGLDEISKNRNMP